LNDDYATENDDAFATHWETASVDGFPRLSEFFWAFLAIVVLCTATSARPPGDIVLGGTPGKSRHQTEMEAKRAVEQIRFP
jgi:hypothetical protein